MHGDDAWPLGCAAREGTGTELGSLHIARLTIAALARKAHGIHRRRCLSVVADRGAMAARSRPLPRCPVAVKPDSGTNMEDVIKALRVTLRRLPSPPRLALAVWHQQSRRRR